jgi:hypothetical protein
MKPILCLFTALLCAGLARAETTPDPVPSPSPLTFLRPGEQLEFRLSWGLIGNAGSTRIETTRSTDAEHGRHWRIDIVTQSRGIVNTMYPIANDSRSIIDYATGRPLQTQTEGRSGKRQNRTLTLFDYESNQVVHTDFERPARSGTAPLPDTPAYDLMVAMMQAREWNLQVGERRQIVCTFEDDFYDILVTAVREERVRTPLGTFDAVVVEPTQIGELKGFFRRGGTIRVWISRGEHPQMVRIEFRTRAGTIVSSLVEEVRGDAHPGA